MSRSRLSAVLLLMVLAAVGCASSAPRGEAREAVYRQALADSAARATANLEPEEARRRFADFYRAFTPEEIRRRAPEFFADDAYLNDQLKELRGLEAITEYLAETSEAFGEAGFEVEGAAREGSEYYFRWTLSFRLAGREDEPPRVAPGLSHVRFDANGRVIFERDYWDTASAVYESIPVLGGLIRAVKRRL